MTETEQIIEMRGDPEINVEEIMQRVRERVRQRRALAAEQGLDYDHLMDDRADAHPAGRLSADLYYDLHQLRTNVDAPMVSLAMRDRQFAIFNALLFRIERLLHRLVIKYSNVMAGRQVVFNRASVHVITELARALEEDGARIAELEKQVTDLRERLARGEVVQK
jgi:hypothetical protein